MHCAFCHQEGCNYFEKDINFELLIATIKKLYEIGYRKFKLMGGEPMLYPKIKSVVKSVRNIATDIDLSMISNGSANVSKYIELFECGLDRLNISVHGWNEDYFCENTGNSPEMHNMVKSNIIELIKSNKINKINYVLQKGKNESDFYSMINDIKEFDVVVDVLNLLLFPNNINCIDFHYSFQEIENLILNYWDVKKIINYNNPYSLPSRRLLLDSGCSINLKVNKLNEQEILFSCRECLYKEFCIEGIKAIRLTNDGVIQPCLLRSDNTFKISENTKKSEIIDFLRLL